MNPCGLCGFSGHVFRTPDHPELLFWPHEDINHTSSELGFELLRECQMCFTQHQESVKVVYLLLRSFAVRLIGSFDTVLAVLESMLATFISPISTTLMTQSFLLMIQRNETAFFEILRHQQLLWVSTQTGIKRRSKILTIKQ